MKPFEALDKTLDIVPLETEVVELETTSSNSIKPTDKTEDREKDYQAVRLELYSLIQKGQNLIDGAIEVAEQSQHPRAYEVASTSIKNVADIAEKLMDLHKKLNDVTNEETNISQTNVQNNVFVTGTTSEVMKMLRDANNS